MSTNKTVRLIMPLGLLLVTVAAARASDKQDKPAGLTREQTAVLEVIDGQIAARWANDFDKWSSYWVHAPYVRRVGSSLLTGLTYIEGWDAIAAKMKEQMASGTKLPPVTRDNYNIKVYRDSAFATFDQRGEMDGKKFISRETRILEKQAGKWKLVYLGHVFGPDGPVATKAASPPARP